MMSVNATVMVFSEEKLVFLKEKSSRVYSTLPYFVAKMVMEVLPTFILPLILSLLTYFAMGLGINFFQFFVFYFVIVLEVMTGMGFGYIIATICSDS